MSAVALIQGNAMQIPLRDKSAHAVVTSPPYFGLRDYGTATWDGGNPACKHQRILPDLPKDATSTLTGRANNQNHERQGYAGKCPRCGAVRIDEQLGLEALHDCNGAFTGIACGAGRPGAVRGNYWSRKVTV